MLETIYIIGTIFVAVVGCYLKYKNDGNLTLLSVVFALLISTCFWWLIVIVVTFFFLIDRMDKITILKRKEDDQCQYQD